MSVYWQIAKQGQQLIVETADRKERVGMVRETRSGFDALAVTFGYEPGRARRDMESMEEAKAVVESFEPLSLYLDEENVCVEPDIRTIS